MEYLPDGFPTGVRLHKLMPCNRMAGEIEFACGIMAVRGVLLRVIGSSFLEDGKHTTLRVGSSGIGL